VTVQLSSQAPSALNAAVSGLPTVTVAACALSVGKSINVLAAAIAMRAIRTALWRRDETFMAVEVSRRA